MGHGEHHEEKQALSLFASPLHHHEPETSASDLELQQKQQPNASITPHNSSEPEFENMDYPTHDSPSFHRHAEATTHELFYDLFFVANLTTFTSMLEINDRHSLTAYVGFFSLLWLTWYQVTLYDVRFSADSIFERCAKAIHFGVMVGFAVIGPQWKPGQEIPTDEYKIYKAFGLMLMVSRLTLFCQYAVTLSYTRKYKKIVVPLLMIMGWTLLAAILYGSLTPLFPGKLRGSDGVELMRKSNVYISWYVIAISETILTVTVSCVWRIISFKGTHMVQRMGLLTLIILGEGIIVVCKSISKIVKNEYLWTAAVVAQIIIAVLIIYFLYMLYFDHQHEEHFGSIKQQIWSFLHFPLHVALVLVLQGVSLLIIWRQAVESLRILESAWVPALDWIAVGGEPENGTQFASYIGNISDTFSPGEALASYFNETCYQNVYSFIPKGVDASKEIKSVAEAFKDINIGFDNYVNNQTNITAYNQFTSGINKMTSSTFKTLFDTFSVTISKNKLKKLGNGKEAPDMARTILQYYNIFDLIMTYAFVAGGVALILSAIMGFLSLPMRERRASSYARLGAIGALGLGLALVSLIRYTPDNMYSYLSSAWMIPTICLTLFICVVISHIRAPKKKAH